MGAMKLQSYFLLMALLLKPKLMCALLILDLPLLVEVLNLYWIVQLLLKFFIFFAVLYMQNGMTPLHLSVWHSIRSEDYSTVKTLLEYNADCSAMDNVL